MKLLHIADRIVLPDNTTRVVKRNFMMLDIINLIFIHDKQYRHQTEKFADYFEPTYHGMRKLWKYIRTNIAYKKDPKEREDVKSPGRTQQDKFGDCKSMSLYIASILYNMGIPYSYRIVGYEDNPVGHIYPIAHLNGADIVIDAVHTEFDEELGYKVVEDYTENESGVFVKSAKISGFNAVKNKQEISAGTKIMFGAAVIFGLYKVARSLQKNRA